MTPESALKNVLDELGFSSLDVLLYKIRTKEYTSATLRNVILSAMEVYAGEVRKEINLTTPLRAAKKEK